MCSPTQAALSGLQLGSSYMAQKGQADMQELSNEFAEDSAKLAFQTDKNILIRRRQEEGEAFAQSNFDRQRMAMELEAQANVAAGEAGVSGISVDRITRDIGRQSGEVGQRAKKSYENRLAAVDDQQTRAVNTMVGRMANLPPVVQPNLLAMAITTAAPYVASGALDGLFKGKGKGGGESVEGIAMNTASMNDYSGLA